MKYIGFCGLTALVIYLAVVGVVMIYQRSLLYYPTHDAGSSELRPWMVDGKTFGCCREVKSPKNLWLMLHGNGGQACHRSYALNCLSPEDSFYVVEYPGYGVRPGSPSKESMTAAALEAYESLRKSNPGIPLCVLGESIGSGPASALAKAARAPDKIVLVVPFDTLASVAQEHFRFLPVSLLLFDNWDNIESLKDYRGQVDVFGAIDDDIIPIHHAKNLASRIPHATFHAIPGGHNDWSVSGRVQIRNR